MLFSFLGQKSVLGIDIGTTSIKIVELRKVRANLELANYGILEKYGHLERINDAIQTSAFKLLEESTALLLRKLLVKMKTKEEKCYMSLPNFSSFVVPVEFPEMTSKELAKAVKYQASQYIPISLQDMTLDWQIERKGEGKLSVLIVAVPTETIKRYVRTAELAKLDLKGLEVESIAVSHLFGIKEKNPVVIVDIGGRATSISVLDQGMLQMTLHLDTAGGDLTQVLATGLKINPFRAEEMKRNSGLYLQQRGNLDVVSLFTPLLDVIKREIEKASNQYYMKSKRRIKKIVLTGGGANLKGLPEYYSRVLSLPVEKGDPFSWGLISYSPQLAPLIPELGPSLTVACAVAFLKL